MIKLETHCHTGASSCADCPQEVIAENLKAAGYGGAVITNHLNCCFRDYEGDTDKQKIKYYLSVYESTRKIFEIKGLKTFFAAEVTAYDPVKHMDFIIYGLDEKFLFDHKPLMYYTQEELFKMCDERGYFMYKCHPFRTGECAGEPKFMHGAESFNGHFHHANNNELAEKFCEENGLIKMSGTDYHHADQPFTAGIWLPDDIKDEAELTEFVFKNDFTRIEEREKYMTYYKKYKGII